MNITSWIFDKLIEYQMVESLDIDPERKMLIENKYQFEDGYYIIYKIKYYIYYILVYYIVFTSTI